MSFGTTIVFYLLIGAGVGAGMLVMDDRTTASGRILLAASALVFWPLYLPVLLERGGRLARLGDAKVPDCESVPMWNSSVARPPSAPPNDDIAVAIAQVERELDAALVSLDGWAGSVLAQEDDRFAELRTAWQFQASRIRELDRLLAQPSFRVTQDKTETADVPNDDKRILASRRARLENVARLSALREQLYRDLCRTLACVRELVTLIHLAKYTGAPASRAEELVSQIAAAVEGLSEVANWRSEENLMGA